MEIPGEMQVDVLHRHHLCVAAAGRAALHAEARPERWLADADGRFLADPVQPVAQADRRGRLAFSGRRRVDRCDQNQPAFGSVGQTPGKRGGDFGLVVPVGQEMLLLDAQPGRHPRDGFQMGFPRDLDIRLCHIQILRPTGAVLRNCQFRASPDTSVPPRACPSAPEVLISASSSPV